MKKILLLLTALVLCFVLVACGSSEQPPEAEQSEQGQTAQVPNPMTTFESFDQLAEALPDIMLFDAPAGSARQEYYTYDTEPMIAEVRFAYVEDTYYLRAAYSETEADMQDISGTSMEFEEAVVFTSPIGVEYTLKSTEDFGVLDFYLPEYKTQYNITVQTENDSETLLSEIMRLILIDYV